MRENRYSYIALSGIYQDGAFNLNSLLYSEKIVSLKTVLKYLQPDSSQKLVLRIEQGTPVDGGVDEMANQLFSLLGEYRVDTTDVVIASSNRQFIDTLIDLGVHVSYIVSSEAVLEAGGFQYEAVSIDLKDPFQLQNLTGSDPIDVWISSCNINSCDEKYLNRLDELAGKANIRNVFMPMFDL